MKRYQLTFKRWLARRRTFAEPFEQLIRRRRQSTSTPFDKAELVCLDIETTSLDAKTTDMLSIGWVLIRNGMVDLSTAETYVVRTKNGVGESASVHGLTDTMVSKGQVRQVVLDKVIEALTGRCLVVHHAGLDKDLLDRLCVEHYGEKLLVPVVDTLAIERRRQTRRHHANEHQSLRLADLRTAYNLPWYSAHNCLTDAIATAELLIAMVVTHGDRSKTPLADLY